MKSIVYLLFQEISTPGRKYRQKKFNFDFFYCSITSLLKTFINNLKPCLTNNNVKYKNTYAKKHLVEQMLIFSKNDLRHKSVRYQTTVNIIFPLRKT